MGTRGLYGFRKYGKDKLTYNHFYSHPDFLGREVAEFCQSHYNELDELYEKIILVDESSTPTTDTIAWSIGNNIADFNVNTKSKTDWYCLLRDLQGDLEKMRTLINRTGKCYMIDSSSFIKDSLFCEYAYIINLDSEMFEFWVGFQKKPWSENRYGDSCCDGYYPCKMLLEIPLKGIDANSALDAMNEAEEAA